MVDNSEKIKSILEQKKLEYKETEKHFQVSCPLCTDTRFRLGISRKGPWRCMNCNQRGKQLSTLIFALDHIDKKEIKKKEAPKAVKINQQIHVKTHEAIKKRDNKEIVKYVTDERKLSLETLNYFQLGYRSKFQGKDCGPYLAIPYLVHGKCVCLKYRSLDPDIEKGFKWRREKGGLSILFNSDILDDHDHSTVLICESEIDAMSIHDMGFKNVVGLTTGAQSFASEWVEQLKRFKKIYLMLDNDEAGREGTQALIEKLGINRCYITTLPEGVKDPNEMLQKGMGRKELLGILRDARRPDVANVVSGYNSYLELEHDLFSDRGEDHGLEYGLGTERDNLGKAGKGHLIIIGGKPKCIKHDSVMVNPETMESLTIKQVVESKMKTCFSLNEKTNKIEVRPISDWIFSGVKQAHKLVLRSGVEIEAFEDHEFLQFTGWNKLKNLVKGDYIAVPNKLSQFDSEISFVQIKSINKTEMCEMHDISVPDTNNYIANNVVCHNCGKTSKAVQWATHFAKTYGGVGFYSCEMRVSKLTEKQILLSAPCQEKAFEFEHKYDKYEDITTYSKSSMRTTLMRVPNKNMHFYYPKAGDLELDKVIATVRDMILRYDLKTFFFDNLHFLCRGDNANEKIEMATREFKLLAETLDVPIYLITHPKKTNSHYMKVEDLKGSSAIIQDADTIVLMSRTFDFQRGNDLGDDDDEAFGDFSHNLVNFDVISRWKEDSSFQLYFSGHQARYLDTGYFYRESLNKLKQKAKNKKDEK